MATRGGFQRDDARHWLPTQGVDPAPLAELNGECLALLVERASEPGAAGSLPPLLTALTAASRRMRRLRVKKDAWRGDLPRCRGTPDPSAS